MATDGQYLAALRRYYAKHQTLPSYATIGRLVGLSSKASVAEMVGRLKEAGFISSTPDRRLRPGARFFERAISGSVRAGLPEAAIEIPGDDIGIDAYLVRDPANTVLVRVRGDSMINAAILDGDIAIVERRSNADQGQIVVARLQDEITLKRLIYRNARPVLRAENSAYRAIYPAADAEILGVVVGIVRRFG